jgi:uncharacterized protein YecE (DUF72 family)
MPTRGPRDEPKSGPVQLGLFGPLTPPAPTETTKVLPAPIDAALRALGKQLPAALHLGTSSWNFPGWRGLVYAPDAPKAHLSRHGLSAYAQHPLLRTVGIDRTYYAPIAAAEFAGYAAQVPTSFRFLVKGLGELLNPVREGRQGHNPRYLDADAFTRECVEPACAGLGDRLGTLLLQFPPQTKELVQDPAGFAELLDTFLAALPPDVPYAVELRDAALLTSHYRQVLRDRGVQHGFVVHPRMPPLRQQLELIPLDLLPPERPLVVRWMLHQGLVYEAAVERYEPFDRLVDADPGSRSEIAALAQRALQLGRGMIVVVNNKAEGCSPGSVLELARAIVMAMQPSTS